MARFEKSEGAIGFALYLDEIGRTGEERPETVTAPADDYLNVALPKGRMGDKVYRLFDAAGLGCKGIPDKSRKLVFEDDENKVRYFLVKPSDVDIYVEHGAADIGVVGRDTLLENGADVLELLDMKMGVCKLAVAAKRGYVENPTLPLRVATKYPAIARRYYAEKSRSVEVIKLHGSIELAPLTGLSDVIVDIVESGNTLRENNLVVREDIAPSSARLIANRAAWRFKEAPIRALLKKLEEIV
jgi:ATP phosphoribosyltransferase regulatory subunit